MHPAKESLNFNNPLGIPTENIKEIISDWATDSVEVSSIKSIITNYIKDNDLSEHKKLRLIEATNKLIVLLKGKTV